MNDFIVLTLSHYIPLLSAFLVAVPFAWMAFRSRSLFVLRYRLWRLTQPKGDIQDKWVREAVQARADLISFRSVLMWADTPGDAHRLAKFAEERDLDVGSIGECGSYFDRQELRVRDNVPGWKSTVAISAVPIYLFCAALALLLMMGVQDRALVAFKDGGSWFWLGNTSARLVHGNHNQTFTLSDCSKPGPRAGFTAEEAKNLCTFFADPSLAQGVKDGVSSQRWLALVGSCFFLGLLAIVLRHLHAVRAAHAVRKWLERTRSPAEEKTSTAEA